MKKTKCFEVVDSVLEIANKNFAPLWRPDLRDRDILRQYCDAIDEVVDEFDGTCFEVNVDEISMYIHVELTCREITLRKGNLLAVIERSIETKIVKRGDEFGIHFVFPSIWRHCNLRLIRQPGRI